MRSSGSSATLYFTRAFNPGYFVENSGTILNSGSGSAVAGQTWLTLLNNVGGTISTDATAISAPSFLSVQNEGIIEGGTAAIASDGTINLVNRGTINGDVRSGSANSYAGSVIDNIGGTINGSVVLGEGNDLFIGDTANFANPIGAITGILNAGGGVDTLRFTFVEDTLLDGPIPLPQSLERLTLRIGGSSALTLSENFNASYGLGIGGGDESYYNVENQFINNGTIVASGPALVSDGAGGIGVTNNGTITTTLGEPASFAVDLGQISSFENNSTITATAGNGVRTFGADEPWKNGGKIIADGTAVYTSQSIVNTGEIRSVKGIGLELSGALRRPSLNSGSIAGASAGARVYYSNLVNEGSISSPVAGIEIGSGGRVVNRLTGRISGGVAPATQGFVTQGAQILNAGIIDGDVNFGTPEYPQSTYNVFAALQGGVVNGNVNLGGGNDVFATSLINTGPGEFAGITGTVSGSGQETLRYIVDADATATPQLLGIFDALAYDLSNDAKLTLTAPTSQALTIGFSGIGKVDLTADLTGNGSSVILDLRQISIQPGEDGTLLPTNVDVTSRGTITLRHEDASTYVLPVVALATGSSFTNAGTIVVQDAAPNNYYNAPSAIAVSENATVINTGTISLDGAIGIRADSFYGDTTVDNQGTITQGPGDGFSRGVVNASVVKNSGRISTSGTAVEFLLGSLFNSGIIESSAAQAVLGSGYGSARILNDAGGVISGGVGFDAIDLAGTSIVSNAGTINGNVDLAFDVYGYGYSSGNSAYVDRGGTLNGNLTFGSGDDIFVSTDGSIGVSGVIDAGAGVDTFIRSYSVDTTVDWGTSGSAPAGFERQGIGASGKDTVVTLTGAPGAFTTPVILIGDGTIINVADIAPATLSEPRRVVTLGAQIDPLNVTGAGSTLSFINRGNLGNGVQGNVRSFANEGRISSGRLDTISVIAVASDPTGFTFQNSGLIAGAERAPYDSYSPIGALIGNADPAVSLANAIVTNSGTIAGGISVDIKAKQFSFDNSGTITRSNLFVPSVSILVGQPYIFPGVAVPDVESVDVNNSGTIRTSVDIGTVAPALAFNNSGTIGPAGSAPSVSLAQNGQQTFDPDLGYSIADLETLKFDNSGAISGTANLFSNAKTSNVTNSGTILLEASANYPFIRTGGTVLSLEISTQGSQSLNLSNSGAISTTHLGSGALLVAGYTLDGEYGYDENGEAATPVPGAPTSTITITNTGTIRADGGAIYQPAMPAPYPGYPDGVEYVQPNIALAVTGSSRGVANISVTNALGGLISASGITQASGGTEISLPEAFKTIGSTAFDASANIVSLINAGTIQGLVGGIVPEGVSLELDAADYEYSGRFMAGAIQTFASADMITNTRTGVITGSVDLGTMDDALINLGTVNGDIYLRSGNDSMTHNIGGMLNGVADGGAGTDALTIDITGGGLLDQATLDKFVNFESETITGTGTITTSGPFAADSLILRDANVTLAAGNVLETASDVALIFAGGTNSLLNLGTIKGSIVTSAATTRIVNQGQISGPLTFGDGDDELIIGSGASFTGPVNGGAGRDVLILKASGSDAAPYELALSPFTGFERLRQESGTVAMSGTFTTGIFDLVSGRFIGRTGSTLTADRINVAQGTTFGSAGTVNGNIVVQGILSPGSSPGTMTVNGSVALASG
ncbi:MAG: beta strand repeat-containing protein, partial [Sphingobium sp.]